MGAFQGRDNALTAHDPLQRRNHLRIAGGFHTYATNVM